MSLAPRVVVVHRRSEYAQLLARHGTRAAAAFFLSTRGRDLDEVEARHGLQAAAQAAVLAAIALDWRRGTVERADLDRFLFAPDDVVVAVGQDGLVANVAKYLDGQPVIGVDAEPGRNPGVLVRHRAEEVPELLQRAVRADADRHANRLTMVQARLDNGQELLALNEVYVGQATHQTARYRLTLPDGRTERQASSGVLVGTGTGATGWCRSVWLERRSGVTLPQPAEPRLAWFAREAWPSPVTGTTLTEGELAAGAQLRITVESDGLVAFGDGIESDALALTWGQTLTLSVAQRRLRLL